MARCQVCDGPIVNGRCKLCGMPYRRDEILYHLNESESEHYKHATAKARAQMKQARIPISDREKAASSSGKKSSQKAGAAHRSTQAENRTQVQEPGTKEILDERIRRRRQAVELEKMQKSGKTRSRLLLILSIGLLALVLVPKAVEYIRNEYEPEWAWTEQKAKKAVNEHVDTEELLLMGLMDNSQPEIEVGDTFDQETVMPGEYVLEVPLGYLEILVQYAESEKGEDFYEFRDGEGQVILELHKGDRLSINGYDNKNNYVMMFLIEQYDELTQM